MNPAIKKYPRPTLPLLRQRFKQRDQRQMINHPVSAKRQLTATINLDKLKSVGGATTPVTKLEHLLAARAEGEAQPKRSAGVNTRTSTNQTTTNPPDKHTPKRVKR